MVLAKPLRASHTILAQAFANHLWFCYRFGSFWTSMGIVSGIILDVALGSRSGHFGIAWGLLGDHFETSLVSLWCHCVLGPGPGTGRGDLKQQGRGATERVIELYAHGLFLPCAVGLSGPFGNGT